MLSVTWELLLQPHLEWNKLSSELEGEILWYLWKTTHLGIWVTKAEAVEIVAHEEYKTMLGQEYISGNSYPILKAFTKL